MASVHQEVVADLPVAPLAIAVDESIRLLASAAAGKRIGRPAATAVVVVVLHRHRQNVM